MSEHVQGEALLDALESGEVRVAEPDGLGAWRVHAWVKEGILDIFRTGTLVEMPGAGGGFVDKRDFPVRAFSPEQNIRLVPGGSAVRRGSFVAAGTVLMPPCYVNVGAYVGAGSMIDSHALVGSCAQVGERVHLSAAAQLGGVLEPVGSRPVIIEDDCMIGGGAGVYEGVCVGKGAVLAAGTILTASTPVFDLANNRALTPSGDAPLEIPAGAVVVPGTRPASGEFAKERGLAISCALIVKYRDERTQAAVTLEDSLR